MQGHHFDWTCVVNGIAVQVLLLSSHCWTNTLVTGIAFAGESSDGIAVAGYDCDKIQMYKVS